MEQGDNMKLESMKRVRKAGNSLVIPLTKELRAMGLDEGDLIRVTIEPVTRL